MNEIPLLIIILLSLYAAIGILDQISIQWGFYTPLFAGVVTGFLLGDVKTGLEVGATLMLMTLGVATYGGASVPDYLSGAIMGTAYAIMSGQGVEYGLALAIPIGLLLTQCDILGRMANSIFLRRAERCLEKEDYRGIEICNLLCIIPWALSRMIPVFLGLYFGEAVVSAVNAFIPDWFMTGLQAASKLLPAMGLAILMRYLPFKKFFPYFILGFALMAYGSSIFTVLFVALVELALAGIHYYNNKNRATVSIGNGAADEEEVEIDE